MDICCASRQLLELCLPHSAGAILNNSLDTNYVINSLKAAAYRKQKTSRMPRAIYMMVTIDKDIAVTDKRYGIVVPIHCDVGNLTANDKNSGSLDGWDEDARNSFNTAYEWCAKKSNCAYAALPWLLPHRPDLIYIEGKSVGLSAVLACRARFTGHHPALPVIATGEVAADGRVLSVEHMREKLSAAQRELNGADGLVLAPQGAQEYAPKGLVVREIATIEEALTAVWGTSEICPDPALLDLEAILQKASDEKDHRAAARMLEGVKLDTLPPADRAIVLFELGKCLRHTGDSAGARRAHGKIHDLLDETGRDCVPSHTSIETIEVEILRTEMAVETNMRMANTVETRLAQGFLSAHNGVRLRGMLAELLSTLGDHTRVLALRKQNLAVQNLNLEMKKEIPRTRCSLVWEAARSGEETEFIENIALLLEESPNADRKQQRYNDAAIVRGMVLLKRYDELSRWLSYGVTTLPGQPGKILRQLTSGTSEIKDHPEISAARALVRMYRKQGKLEQALKLSKRVTQKATEGLFRWLCKLVLIEKGLVHMAAGDTDKAWAEISAVVESFRGELGKITQNHPAFRELNQEKERLLDQNFWEPLLDTVYY